MFNIKLKALIESTILNWIPQDGTIFKIGSNNWRILNFNRVRLNKCQIKIHHNCGIQN